MAELVDRLEKMQSLRDSVLEIERDQNPDFDAVKRVKAIVRDAEDIATEAKGSVEMLLDGQIFNAGQNVFRGAVQNLNTNLVPFCLDDYVNGISAFLEPISFGRELNWSELSKETFSLIKMSPKLDYKLGTFELDPPPKPEKIAKERQKKGVKTEKSVVATVQDTGDTDKKTKQYGEHLLKHLVLSYRKNRDQPINYFKFIIDPTDFWRTVHNAYHFSHLVKDNMAKMSILDGQPVVEPRKKSREEQQSISRNQFNFRLTPYEYRQLIQAFHITESLIPPL